MPGTFARPDSTVSAGLWTPVGASTLWQALDETAVSDLPYESGITLWLKADAGVYTDAAMTVAATLDGDVVGGWADQSGLGNHVTQATTAKKPLLKTGIMNGKPVLRLDGIDDLLVTAGAVDLTAGFTAIIVARNAVRKSFNGLLRIAPDATSESALVEFHWREGTLATASGHLELVLNRAPLGTVATGYSSSNAGPAVGSPYVVVATASAAGVSIHANGALRVSVTTGATPDLADLLWVGMGYHSTGILNGDIAEVIVYASALSDTDRGSVESFLNTKYAAY